MVGLYWRLEVERLLLRVSYILSVSKEKVSACGQCMRMVSQCALPPKCAPTKPEAVEPHTKAIITRFFGGVLCEYYSILLSTYIWLAT